MRRCRVCGGDLPPRARYCPNCSTPVPASVGCLYTLVVGIVGTVLGFFRTPVDPSAWRACACRFGGECWARVWWPKTTSAVIGLVIGLIVGSFLDRMLAQKR